MKKIEKLDMLLSMIEKMLKDGKTSGFVETLDWRFEFYFYVKKLEKYNP